MECKQTVPDFLEMYRPENDELSFDDNSEDEFFDTAGDDAGSEAKSEAGFDTQSANVKGEENSTIHEFENDPSVKSKEENAEEYKGADTESDFGSTKGGLGQSTWAPDAKEEPKKPAFWDEKLKRQQPRKAEVEDFLPPVPAKDSTNW